MTMPAKTRARKTTEDAKEEDVVSSLQIEKTLSTLLEKVSVLEKDVAKLSEQATFTAERLSNAERGIARNRRIATTRRR